MANFIRSENGRFAIAIVFSLLLHASILAIKQSTPQWKPQQASNAQQNQAESRLDVTIATPPKPAVPQPLTPPAERERPKRVLTMPPKHEVAHVEVPARTWTRAERDDMNQFLNEITEESRPASGAALAQRALTMARNMHSPEASVENDESKAIMQRLIDAKIEPFSLELYFDALFKKMNRSAAMIGNQQRSKGIHAAAVRIMLKPDGSVRSFEILREADQQAEIAFIKAVVDLASPFPQFPQDIHNATNALALLICIRPGESGGGNGAMFTRMSDGQACR